MSAEAPPTARPVQDDPVDTPTIVISSAPPSGGDGPPTLRAVRRRRGPRTPRAPRPPLGPGVALVVWLMVACSLASLWVLVYSFVLSGVQEGRDQHELYGVLREQLGLATAPLGGVIEPGSPVAVLQIPALELSDLVVVEGTASGDLQSGPGHRRDTVLPGQHGTSVLFGRSVTFGAPFARISSLRPGDVITSTTGQGQFTYVVDGVRRTGDPLPPVLAASAARLTLVTSEGSGWQAGWAPSHTLYVDATLRGPTVPAPPGRPRTVPAPEKSMQGNPNALVGLVLWLAGLVLVVVTAAWGRARWGRWQTWLVGVPAVLACVWGATALALQLLPNLV